MDRFNWVVPTYQCFLGFEQVSNIVKGHSKPIFNPFK